MPAPDEAMRRIAVVLQELADRLEREMLELTASLDSSGGVLAKGSSNLQSVAGIRRQVAAVAEREGLPKIVAALRAELPAVVTEALEASGLPIKALRVDITRELVAILEGQEIEIAKAIVEGVSDEMASAMRHAITGAVDMSALHKSVAKALDTSLGRAAIGLDRAVREIGDRALISAGKEASDLLDEDEFVYIYEGPIDEATRDYCRDRAQKYLTAAQADALAPRERFRCRHVPAPTLLSEALADGIEAFKG